MDIDRFSLAKQFAHVGEARVAYRDTGSGPPVVLLHGCPFSSFVWRNIIPPLAAAGHRCLAAQHPGRIDELVLSNAEAYDNWPSSDERPFIGATQLPGIGRLVLWAWSCPGVLRWALAAGHTAGGRSVLTGELARGYVRANLSDAHERAERLAEDIPGVERVAVLPGAGHLVREDQPERFAEILTELLTTADAPAPARTGGQA